MHRTANQFIQQQKMLDLAVMGDLGLDQADQEELLGLKGARVEFGLLLDLTVRGTGKAIRLFSAPKSLSSFRVTKGRLPQKEGELALASFWEDQSFSLSYRAKANMPCKSSRNSGPFS